MAGKTLLTDIMTFKLQIVVPEKPDFYWVDLRENLKLPGHIELTEENRVIIENAISNLIEKCIGPVSTKIID